jgi:FXSXX-COOH protein
MQSLINNHTAVVSSLADIRDTPLDELTEMNAGIIGEVIERMLPESPVAPVPVAAFQSAI